MIEILMVRVDDISEAEASALVSGQRREQAVRFVREKDRKRSYAAGWLMERCVPHEGPLRKDAGGKPCYEKGEAFNVSHGGDYAVLAVGGDRPLGVDVERLARRLGSLDFLIRAIAPEEAEYAKGDKGRLMAVWTRREALFKCRGARGDIRHLPSLLPDEVILEGDHYSIKTFLYDGHAVSLAINGRLEETSGCLLSFGTEEKTRIRWDSMEGLTDNSL